jgi:hypothetical protein
VNGYHRLWWYGINDNERRLARGVTVKGSMLRAGRWFLHYYGATALKLSWSFFGGRVLCGWRDWFRADAVLRFSTGDDRGVTLHLSLSRLASAWITVGLPQRWLSPWMIEDRDFGVRLGYIGDIAWVQIGHAEWAESTGMGDYYRRGHGSQRYSRAQLWPGWEIKLRWPRVLDWVLGRAKRDKRILSTVSVQIPLDGRTYAGTVNIEAWETRRARWPWAYGKSVSSYIDVPHPPQFAGKGENSWDCDDDGIYGMGSRETSPAAVVGDYIKRVLESRERYGMPRGA